MGLADLGAGGGELLDGDEALPGLAGAHQIPGRGLAQAGDGHKRRAQALVLRDEKLRGVGLVEVDGGEVKAPHVHLVHGLHGDQQILLVCREGGAAVHLVDPAPHVVGPAAHHGRVEAALLTAAVEVGRVEGQGLVYLEPGDAEGHHDIGHRVSLGEEVGDLAGRLDVPLRHAERAHLLLRVVREGAGLLHLALAHGLHGLEGQGRLDADRDEIEHDVVAAADGLVNTRDAVYDQIMDVAGPHVRAVGEAGEADQGVKLLRLGVHQHLAGEGGAEFRHADGARVADDGVVVRQAQGRRGGEDGHGVRVGQGDFLGVHPGHILHHADHGGVIVAQLVQLEEVCLHAVVLKMRGDDVGVGVVRRVLDRAEVGDVLVLGDDHKAARVLARGALDAHKAQRQAVFLRLGGLDAPLLEILFHIAVGGLLGQGADGASPEHMVGAEERLGIFVGLGLVLAGEVQVDIRRLLVAGEAQEGLKRDVEALPLHARAALRAVLFRHVRAAAVAAVGDELRVAALGADIVRRQGVDLRDAGHVGHDRGADAPPRADQVAVFQGVLHQLLGGHVDDVVLVVKDGVELRVHAALHDLGRVFAVDAVHLVIDQALEVLGGILDFRCEEILGQKLDLLHLVGNGSGVGDDDLFRHVLAEVSKLRQHLLGVAEEDGAVPVGVGELLGSLEDLAVLLVLGVEKMHVRGGDDGLAHLFPQLVDGAVVVLQDPHVGHGAVIHQEGVVADGLDLQIVVELRDLFELLVACALHDGAVELAHAAGRAHKDALPVLEQQALRHGGAAVEILQIGLGDHLVEVLEPHAIFHQQHHVVGLGHVRSSQGVVDGLDVVHGPGALLFQHGQEFAHHARHHHGVVRGAVVVEGGQPQVVGDDVQLEALEFRAEGLAQGQGVQKHRGETNGIPACAGGHEAHVEVCVVGDDGPIPHEGHELLQGLLFLWRALHVAVADAGQLRDVRRDVALGIDKGVENLEDLVPGKADGADLGHAVGLGVEAGGLDVEGHKLRVQRQARLADDGAVAVHVVDVVGLHAVDDLDAVLLARLPHVREGLGHAVVRDGDGGHAPVGCPLHDGGGVRQRVQGGEAGVHVQLHALFLRVIRAHIALALHDVPRVQDHVVVVLGVDDLALDDQVVAGTDLIDDGLVVLRAQKARDAHGVGAVGDVKAEHGAAALGERPAGDGHHVALHGDLAGFQRQGVHGHRMLLDGPAHQHRARGLCAGARLGRGRRGRARLPGIVRHDADAREGVVALELLGQALQVDRRGHGGKPGGHREGSLRGVHPDVRDICLVQAPRRGGKAGASGENCQKRRVLGHGVTVLYVILFRVSGSIFIRLQAGVWPPFGKREGDRACAVEGSKPQCRPPRTFRSPSQLR